MQQEPELEDSDLTIATAYQGARGWQELTDESFAAAVAGPIPTLVDFDFPWCPQCTYSRQKVRKLAKKFRKNKKNQKKVRENKKCLFFLVFSSVALLGLVLLLKRASS